MSDQLLGAYAWGGPLGRARLKLAPEDFQVTEDLGFEPEGAGEHWFLWVKKRQANTLWVRRKLAEFAGVDEMAVGHSGLKDRQALTWQWFSIQLPGQQQVPWQDWQHEDFQVLNAVQHRQKLKPGSHRGNHFKLVLRDITAEPLSIDQRLLQLQQQGCPNYFGLQRFGRDGRSLQPSRSRDRKVKALYDSAWRARLFNQLLDSRVQNHSWNQLLDGEFVCLAGSNSFFVLEQPTELEQQRCQQQDVHPSGPLLGRGKRPGLQAGELEQQLQALYPDICQQLEQRQSAARRPLRLIAQQLRWHWLSASSLQLEFWLPPGTYATVLLREVLDLIEDEHEDTAEQ